MTGTNSTTYPDQSAIRGGLACHAGRASAPELSAPELSPPELSAPALSAPALSGMIDRVLESYTAEASLLQIPIGLPFPEELETIYEKETCESRVRELRFTVSAAAAFQFVTIITDPVFLPDLKWEGLFVRFCVAFIMVSAVISFRRISATSRELAVCGAAFSFILGMIALICLSHAPLAPYNVFTCTLGFIYANTTAPLRFRFAWPFNLICLGTLLLAMLIHPRISLGLAGVLIFLAVVGSSFSLIANYRMERASRLAYLLASKEALRLSTLARDRDNLEIASNTDGLTGLTNRGHFNRSIAALFDRPAAEMSPVCLLLLDVDFFKRYNDRYGHPEGDACLQQVAKVLLHSRRNKNDLAFRYGGEEFGLLLIDVTVKDGRRIAERVRQAVESTAIKHENRDEGPPIVTVSVGMAYGFQHPFQPREDTSQKLLARTDQALYAAKRAGRNRVEVAA